MFVFAIPFLFIFRNEISYFFKYLSGYDNYGIYEGAGSYTFTIMLMLVLIVTMIKRKEILKLMSRKEAFEYWGFIDNNTDKGITNSRK